MEPQQPLKPGSEQPKEPGQASPMPPPPYDDNGLPADDGSSDSSPEPMTPQPGHRYDHLMPKKEPHKGRTALIVTIVLIVLAGLGAGAYFVFLKSDKKTEDTKQPSTSEQTNREEENENTQPAASTAAGTLKSTKLNLEVTKPAGWLGQEDPASGELTLTSPETTYATTSGSKTGVFVLKVRQGADADSQAAIKNTNAVEASETIAYSAPTQSQRHYTNITVAGTNENASFLIVTSADTFKKGEAMARFFINGDVYVIVGGFREATKTGLMGYDLMPKATFMGSDEYAAAVGIIKSLKIF